MRDEVLRYADYLVIAMPATNETRRTIGNLINGARAEIVDEAAPMRLWQSEGSLRGEPPDNRIA